MRLYKCQLVLSLQKVYCRTFGHFLKYRESLAVYHVIVAERSECADISEEDESDNLSLTWDNYDLTPPLFTDIRHQPAITLVINQDG